MIKTINNKIVYKHKHKTYIKKNKLHNNSKYKSLKYIKKSKINKKQYQKGGEIKNQKPVNKQLVLNIITTILNKKKKEANEAKKAERQRLEKETLARKAQAEQGQISFKNKQ